MIAVQAECHIRDKMDKPLRLRDGGPDMALYLRCLISQFLKGVFLKH